LNFLSSRGLESVPSPLGSGFARWVGNIPTKSVAHAQRCGKRDMSDYSYCTVIGGSLGRPALPQSVFLRAFVPTPRLSKPTRFAVDCTRGRW
jgi:hypothetical protein